MKKFLAALGAVFALIVIIVLVRTWTFTSAQVEVEPVAGLAVDTSLAASHLGRALGYRTISPQDPASFDPQPFQDFNRFLQETYPAVHEGLAREVVNDYSLLYTWEGSDPRLQPVILLAHMDVVPVDPQTEQDWTYPPFSGAIEEGYVWGRGALDDKASLVGIMEAVEGLLQAGFQPRRTLYLAFGHDEEIGGEGAARIAGLLASRGVRAEYILDEGRAVTEGVLPGVAAPVAMVGVAEKGYLTVELSVKTRGGHSSVPPPNTGVGILSRAVVRLEENQLPAAIREPVRQLFEVIGPEMPFFQRMTFANLWLFGGLVKRQLAAAPATNAMIRTTTAATMASGSSKENILPIYARMVVNFRLIPGETGAAVLEHIRRVVDDDRVRIKVREGASEPSVVASTAAASFQALERTIREILPGVLVAPALVLGATDTRHYQALSPNAYRFVPSRVSPQDLKRFHGTDERMSVQNFADIVRFYARLIQNTAS